MTLYSSLGGRNATPSGNMLKRNTVLRKSNRSTGVVNNNNEQTSPTHVSIISTLLYC